MAMRASKPTRIFVTIFSGSGRVVSMIHIAAYTTATKTISSIRAVIHIYVMLAVN